MAGALLITSLVAFPRGRLSYRGSVVVWSLFVGVDHRVDKTDAVCSPRSDERRVCMWGE